MPHWAMSAGVTEPLRFCTLLSQSVDQASPGSAGTGLTLREECVGLVVDGSISGGL